MADTKISALTALTGANVDTSADVLPIVDTSVTTNKKILVSELGIAIGVPAGVIFDYGGTSAPTGFLACDGSAVSQATYAALYAAIGTTWNTGGEGGGNFRLPNFQRRVAVGSGGSGTATLGNSVGNTGGAETHTLSTSEIPAHAHGITWSSTQYRGEWNGVNSDVANGASGSQYTLPTSTNNAGGGGSHNNLQPSAVVLKIIKT